MQCNPRPSIAVRRSAEVTECDARSPGRSSPSRLDEPANAGGRRVDSVARMARDNSIVVEKLVREFKKGPRAVDGIDLYVAPGEIYGFLGPNGAGKSTTVLMLTTLLPPTAGSARVGGYDVRTEGPKVRSVIGAALQEAALDPAADGPRSPEAADDAAGDPEGGAQAAAGGASRPGRAHRRRRPQGAAATRAA